jgi:hypothetical protein
MSLLTGLFLKEAIASTALEHGEACSCTVCLAAGGDIGAFALIWVPAGPGASGEDAPGR